MTGIEMALMAVGTATSVAGSLMSGAGAANAAEYNAAIARRNAAIARSQATADAADKRRSNNRTLGAIHAVYGSSGLTLNGSSLDVLADTAAEQELDARRIEYKGDLRVMDQMERAALLEAQAESARTASYLSAFGNLVSGATRMAAGGQGGSLMNFFGSSQPGQPMMLQGGV